MQTSGLRPTLSRHGLGGSDGARLGGSLSAIDRGRIDDFGAGIDSLGVASSRLGELLLMPFAGLGEGIAKGSAEFLGGINAIVGPIGDVLEPVLSGIGVAFERVGIVAGGIGRIIGAVFEPLGSIFQGLGEITKTFDDSVTSLLRGFVDGAVAVTQWVNSFTAVGVIADNIGAIGDTVSRVSKIISTAFSQVSSSIGKAIQSWCGTAITASFMCIIIFRWP